MSRRSSEQEFVTQMRSFRADVTLATNSLFYTLYGISLVHRKAMDLPVNSFPVPDYPPLKVFPQVAMNSPLSERTGPCGPIEQLAFKAWVTEVYDCLWEATYRNNLRDVHRSSKSGKVLMEVDPIGDLRLIRHDLIHNKSVAKECVKCSVLKWFNGDERMQLRVGHVLDFLNQMGWVGGDAPVLIGERCILWLPFREEMSPSEQAPPLVSVRPLIYEADEFQYRYCASIVFDDGCFANVFFSVDDSMVVNDRLWREIRIDNDGNLFVPPCTRIEAQELYELYFGPRSSGPGTYSPAFRIR
ncbi:MAG: hypothetical protein OXQ89_10510 [Rhodospirillaceae bacterium]|nr:hypothetical protein [Rhodospirillaceae bacterium]